MELTAMLISKTAVNSMIDRAAGWVWEGGGLR